MKYFSGELGFYNDVAGLHSVSFVQQYYTVVITLMPVQHLHGSVPVPGPSLIVGILTVLEDDNSAAP